MRNIILILLFLFASTEVFAQHDMKNMSGMQTPKPQSKPAASSVTYTCPMHPEIHASKPGNCPKCGMKLVKEKPKVTAKPTKNKENVTTKPADKAEKMDMPMPSDKQPSATYTCPMHPEIHSDKPGNCPKCGMNLVNEKPKAAGKNDKMDMQMSSDKQQSATYTCPMHPEIHSDKPGNCPKCGMKLVKEESKSMDDMQSGEMDSGAMDMENGDDLSQNIKKAKANLGPVKTIASSSPPRTVRYDLHIRDTLVTYGKKTKRAIAVNGQIPMPTLTFTEGDTAEIHVYNELDEETSLHWHGLFLPNRMDGVPFLTQMPIKPHSEYLYKFPIVQHGTHWYHSHSGLQEQIGMYGAFIMNKRQEWDIPTIQQDEDSRRIYCK